MTQDWGEPLVEGSQELLITTDHPVWVVEVQEYWQVADLIPGITIMLITGEEVFIDSIELQAELAPVYNFGVDELENYFAGEAGILVHNCGSVTTDLDKLSALAARSDRGGYTFAGRSLVKHSSRPGSVYRKSSTLKRTINSEDQFIVDDILTAPGSRITRDTIKVNGEFIDILDVVAPDGRGLRLDSNRLDGFREP